MTVAWRSTRHGGGGGGGEGDDYMGRWRPADDDRVQQLPSTNAQGANYRPSRARRWQHVI